MRLRRGMEGLGHAVASIPALLAVAGGYLAWEIGNALASGGAVSASPTARLVAAVQNGAVGRAVVGAFGVGLVATLGWLIAVALLLGLLLTVERFRYGLSALMPAGVFVALTAGAEGLWDGAAAERFGNGTWAATLVAAVGALIAMLVLRGLPARGPAILRAGLLVAVVLTLRHALHVAPATYPSWSQGEAMVLVFATAVGGVVADAVLSRIVLRLYAWRGRH